MFSIGTNPVSTLQAIIGDERNLIANCANAASVLWHTLPDINWAGFYFVENNQLVLGPFMGKPACIRIPFGKGVCGTAAKERRTIVVPDVHAFPGHIACDIASRSEVVLPIISSTNTLLGVLDIDSPLLNRFSEDDVQGLEKIVQMLVKE